MMKNKILILVVASMLAIVGFSGCKDESTAGVTDITYYPTIEILGDQLVYIGSGTDYVDAGANAVENGQSTDVVVTSNVDTSTPGSYTVTYSATNADGFSANAKRTVIVYDPNMSTVDLSGSYSGHVIRNADPNREYSGNPVTLTAVDIPGVTGIYEISDWIAGFYDVGYEYGSAYAFTGLIQVNANNEVIELTMSNPWGDPFNSVTGTYDPATGVISYNASWLSYLFEVDLTK
jgi:uncharacterized membrane protein YtjA (UPF0391 family)